MKKLFCILILFFLASCGNVGSNMVSTVSTSAARETAGAKIISLDPALPDARGKTFREGELLVKFRPNVDRPRAMKSHQAVGASVMKRFVLLPGLEHVKLPEGRSVREAIKAYMSDSNVEYAEPNYIKRASLTIPNDPLFRQQWALRNTGQSVGWTPGADIKGAEAWDITSGNEDIIIAVIDTGIDYTHPDIAGNVWSNPAEIPNNGIDEDGNGKIDDWRGWNFVANNNDPMDDNGHGTHVSGIAGAIGNNGAGVSGLMWKVKLLPLKILDAGGAGTTADEIAAIQYAIAKGTKIINASFSGGAFTQAEEEAIAAANAAGVLVMAASGNGGGSFCDDGFANDNDLSPCYPASFRLPNVISVTSTDPNDGWASFSNYGLNSVHVGAPGVEILSTFPIKLLLTGYGLLSGTSMSTPYVSGLAGLLFSNYTHFSHSQVRGMILRFTDTLPALQGRTLTGGKINAYRALSSLLAPSGFSSIQSSGRVTLSWTDNASGEDGYSIERKSSGGSFTQLAPLGANTLSYTDNSLTDGTAYTYRLRVFASLPNPPGTQSVLAESLPVEATATTPLNPPTGLVATAVSPFQVNLTWTDKSGAEEGYKIERNGPDGTFVQIAVIGPDAATFDDSGLSPSTNYVYRVRAFNSAGGDSPYSNETSVTTLAVQPPQPQSGGGGGCSVGAKQNTSATAADIFIFLIPFAAIAMMRSRR